MAKSKEVYLGLIDDLEDELVDSDIRKLKTHLKDAQFGGFRAGELSRTESCRDILTDLLERKGIIGPGNYAKLKELMKRIRNERAVALLSEAEEASGTRMDASKLREKFQHPFIRTTSTEDAASYENNDNKRFKNSYNMMPSKGCPYVVLVKNTIFRDNKEEEKARTKDAENLKKIFLAMKSEIIEATNCTKNRFIELLETNVSGRLEHPQSSYTALFIIMISHGDQRGIQMCRDSNLPDTDKHLFITVEEIEGKINSVNLPRMKGKPKVILIQACRGSATQHDGTEDDAISGALSPLVPHVPVNADILIAHATSRLSLAYRNAEEGSWFINEFCRVVKEDSDHDHILELLTTLNQRVAERAEFTEDGNTLNQMPTFASTFTKKLYLPYPSKPAQNHLT